MNELRKTKISDVKERELLRLIAGFCDSSGPDIPVGFGDDGAVIALKEGASGQVILTTDAMVEGTHFEFDQYSTWATLGHKSIAVNMSDVAAMGGIPHSALVTLGLTGGELVDDVLAFYEAARRLCDRFGCRLIGGDTVRAPQVFVSVTLLGLATPKRPLPLRSRAKPGQKLFVTGRPGESGAGLFLLKNGFKPQGPEDSWMEHLIRRHVQPEPRVHEAAAILQVCPDAAMIDISDGLWNEASLLSDASRCAIFLPERSVPVSPALIRFAELTGWSALEKILFGGEDYELMFTSNTPVEKICDSLNQLGLAIPVTAIGDITTGSGVHLVDSTGAVVPLTDETFSHF